MPYLLLAFLLAVAFTLSTQLCLWREQASHHQAGAPSVLKTLMGDSQRLFANHFFIEADAYLHSGVYPGIFDQPQTAKASHLSEAATITSDAPGHEHLAKHDSTDNHSDHEETDEDHDVASSFLGQPRDRLEAFGRNFFPSRHTHLKAADQREILPWLRLAAELNPNQVETYTVTAFWLRTRLGKIQEAEDFLREGWRANPNSAAIILELGRLHEENHHDTFRARNLYELALRKWQQSDAAKTDADELTYMQITAHLAKLEEGAGKIPEAISYLEMLAKVSPHPELIQKQVEELRTRSSRQSVPASHP